MRVVFLTHYYPPEVGAPQTRIAALAQGLRDHGIEAVVHTGPPHYPEGRVAAPYRNRLLQRERLDGIDVVRSAVLPAPNSGFVRRIGNHLSLAGSALATAGATGPVDVVVAESPPLFTAAAGVAYARRKRVPLVVNVADRWPASAIELGALRDRRAIAAAERLERWIYRNAARVSVPTQGLERALAAEPSAAGRVVRVPPGVDLERFAGAPATGNDDGPLRVVYAGTVGLAHGIATLVEAAHAAGSEVVEVAIAGGGADAEHVRARRDALAATNVDLLGVVPAERVPGLYAGADVGVVSLRDRPIFRGALPTKLLEVMASGRAVVLAAHGESADLVRRAGCGLVVTPDDPTALATALRELAVDRDRTRAYGAAGRAAVEAHARPRIVRRWADLLEEVAGSVSEGHAPSADTTPAS